MAELVFARTSAFILRLFKGYSGFHATKKIEKLMFFYYSATIAIAATIWSCWGLVMGLQTIASIALGFLMLILLNFKICSSLRNSLVGYTILVFASITFPFLFQDVLGGIVGSGFFMIWALLSLIGSLSFQGRNMIYIWCGYFMVLALLACYREATIYNLNPVELPVLLTALNTICVSGIIFGFTRHAVRLQGRLRRVLAGQKEVLMSRQSVVNEDISLAKEFQELLHSNMNVDQLFEEQWVMNLSTKEVTGNFYWQGQFMQNKILVFVENPHSGIRGSMEAILLWNLINSAVVRPQVQAPEDLIDFIQRDLYSRFEVPKIRESMSDIRVTAICHNEVNNIVEYASVGSVLLAKSAVGIEVLKGLDDENGESILSTVGEKIHTGKWRPNKNSKLLCVNQAVLEALEIDDDKGLVDGKGAIIGLFNNNIDTVTAEFRVQQENIENAKDLFFLGVKF